MISNLIYASKRAESCTENEIKNILISAQDKNKGINITGVLLYSNSQFIQFLEGDRQSIFDLYEKIKQDERHYDVCLVSASFSEERLFPSWQMGEKKFGETSFQFDNNLDEEEKSEFERILNGQEMDGVRSIRLIRKMFKN